MKRILIKKLVMIATPWLLLATAAGLACEGEELERTNRMAEHLRFVQQTCNESGSVQDSMTCLREEWGYKVPKMTELPQTCQDILREFEPPPE